MSDLDMSRLGSMKGHPNAPVNEKDIDAWVSRIDDVSNAINDFLQSDPDDIERRREARRKEIAERERDLRKQQIHERYDVAFYRKYEDDKFIDDLLAQVDKNPTEDEEKKKKAQQVSKEHQMTDFERIALEEARKSRVRANDMVVKHRYNEAHELYTTIIALNPDDDALVLAARNNRALTSLKLAPAANFTQAVEDATFVIKQDPKNVKARLRRASALLHGLHRPNDAIVDLRVALKCDSSLNDAKEMMIAAQREAEETDAADRLTREDADGCKNFVQALDFVASQVVVLAVAISSTTKSNDDEDDHCEERADGAKKSSSELEKMFRVRQRQSSEGQTASTVQKSSDEDDVVKFCRRLLSQLVTLSESVNLDDAYSALFRLKNGFGIFSQLISVLARALIFDKVEGVKYIDVAESILLLSASLRIVSTVLNVDRTASAFAANSPSVLGEIFDVCVKIVVLTTIESSPNSELHQQQQQQRQRQQQRTLSITAAAMSALSHIINNAALESTSSRSYNWTNLSGEIKSKLLSVVKQQQQLHHQHHHLVADSMLLSAALMISDEAAVQIMSSSSSSTISALVFGQLDAIAADRDYSSARSKSAAMMLLRVSSKKEIAVEIGKNLDKLVSMLISILSSTSNHQVRFGILAEGVLSAIHNAVVLQVVDRGELAKKLVSPSPSWIPKVFQSIADNILPCVATFSSVVSKFLALLAKSMTCATADGDAIAKIIFSKDCCFFSSSFSSSSSASAPLVVALARATLAHINEQRTSKAKKLADSDQITDIEVVQKTADLWVGRSNGGVLQVNLLENISLVVAAAFQASTSSSCSLESCQVVELAKLAFDMIEDTSVCAPRVAGNAAMWITSKLAADPNVIKYWTKDDERKVVDANKNNSNKNSSLVSPSLAATFVIETPKVRAEKIIKILLNAVKNISSLIYDLERSTRDGENGNEKTKQQQTVSAQEEQQHQTLVQMTTLKGARRNVAVAAAKLCAVEGGLFVEQFRIQGGTQLFGSLQIS